MHISTAKSHRAGMEHIPVMTCFICGKKTDHVDWCGTHCDTCHADTPSEGLGRCMMGVRANMGLTRKELGILLGYSPKTIKKYEWTNPSKRYTEAFKDHVRSHYDDLTDSPNQD